MVFNYCKKNCTEISSGMQTRGSRNYEISTFFSPGQYPSNFYLKTRNNFVHELGHGFNSRLSAGPESFLSDAYTYVPGFPRRPDKPVEGEFYGYASGYNHLTWQMAVTNPGSASENFADMFLGWTYSKWETDRSGYTVAGTALNFFMNSVMPNYINLAAGK
jgi:hypothetical protein